MVLLTANHHLILREHRVPHQITHKFISFLSPKHINIYIYLKPSPGCLKDTLDGTWPNWTPNFSWSFFLSWCPISVDSPTIHLVVKVRKLGTILDISSCSFSSSQSHVGLPSQTKFSFSFSPGCHNSHGLEYYHLLILFYTSFHHNHQPIHHSPYFSQIYFQITYLIMSTYDLKSCCFLLLLQ